MVKYENCPNMQMIGENTAGGVLWCSVCGTVVDEDGEDVRIPTQAPTGANGCLAAPVPQLRLGDGPSYY